MPYEQLTEQRTVYRNTALETIKSLLSLGYRLEAPDAKRAVQLNHPAHPAQRLPPTIANRLRVWTRLIWPLSLRCGNLTTRINGLTRLNIYEPRRPHPQVRRALLAHDVLSEGLTHWPTNARLRQLQALALARSGATKRANRILIQLLEEGHHDEETLGLLARTHKDLWARAVDEQERERQIRLAYEVYNEGTTSPVATGRESTRHDGAADGTKERALCSRKRF